MCKICDFYVDLRIGWFDGRFWVDCCYVECYRCYIIWKVWYYFNLFVFWVNFKIFGCFWFKDKVLEDGVVIFEVYVCGSYSV